MSDVEMDQDSGSNRSSSPVPQDLFSDSDGEGARREDGGATGRSAVENGNSDDDEEERRRKERREKEEEDKKKKKRTGPIRRQMISEDMLTGKNGICKLGDYFQGFEFGGKGREKDDLSNVLARLEQWIHVLHPKQPFDQSLERIEFLGMKRKVIKVHLKKYRMNMLNPDDDTVQQLLEDDDEEVPEGIPEEFGQTSEIRESMDAEVEAAVSSSNNPVARVTTVISARQDEFPDEADLLELENEGAINSTTSDVPAPSSSRANEEATRVTAVLTSNAADEFPDDDDFLELMEQAEAEAVENAA